MIDVVGRIESLIRTVYLHTPSYSSRSVPLFLAVEWKLWGLTFTDEQKQFHFCGGSIPWHNYSSILLFQLLCLVGEAFDDYSDEVCGAVVNIRTKGDKIAVWTSDYENRAAVTHIGWGISFESAKVFVQLFFFFF